MQKIKTWIKMKILSTYMKNYFSKLHENREKNIFFLIHLGDENFSDEKNQARLLDLH